MIQVFIIKKDNKPYLVAQSISMNDHEYLQLVEQCKQEQEKEQKEKEKLLEKINELERKYKEVYGKLLLDEGKITQGEFDNGNY